jgi:DNA polymerase-2
MMGPAKHIRGWLLDVYPDNKEGAIVWVIGEDGRRYKLSHMFDAAFYAAGKAANLRKLWQRLAIHKQKLVLSRETHKELFEGEIDVLAVHVRNAADLSRIFRETHEQFPELDFYNGHIPFALLYHATFDLFPLAFCEIHIEGKRILAIKNRDSRWEIRPELPPIRVLEIEPDRSPTRFAPKTVKLKFENQGIWLSTAEHGLLLEKVIETLTVFDPDIISTKFGDLWLFPFLFQIAKEHGIEFNPNRDKSRSPKFIKENTHTSYGRVFHRDRQTLLFGRAHVDTQNSSLFDDHGLLGFCQQARLTGHTLQVAARKSVGGGFTALQIRKAIETNTLVPANKKRHESFKPVSDLIASDRGGVIFQPTIGIYPDVAEIDFVSMYPTIMSRWNISPEMVRKANPNDFSVPGIDRALAQDQRGIVSQILQPIVETRLRAKKILTDPTLSKTQRERVKTTADALKWLGWVSYGYQGFSGNRIGSIEAHEAINAMSRELILRAKEAAEDAGFTVHHMYVDSLFVSKPGHKRREDFEDLVERMEEVTEIPLDLEHVFRWIAFLPSKQNAEVPVPNCYFGIFGENQLKDRGIMARRHDTPGFIRDTQLDAIALLGNETDFTRLSLGVPKVVRFLRAKYLEMVRGKKPAEMSITQALSKNLDEYRVPSAPARAAFELAKTGKVLGAGQMVEYVHVRGEPDVLPLELAVGLKPDVLNLNEYSKLFLRMAFELLQPFGVDEETLTDWIKHGSGYFSPARFDFHLENSAPEAQLPRLPMLSPT